jgi:hypothetical protein
MRRLALLEDPLVTPLPSYTAADATRALQAAGFAVQSVRCADLAALDRAAADALVLPYRDGDLSGPPLDGLLRFHEQGGGLLFLGDLPHVGRSFPYRNSQAADLRLTRCRDPLQIRGLTEWGRKLLGDLPALDQMLNRTLSALRISAFAPDQCQNLFECTAGFKQLSPVVYIERHHRRFLGARVAVIGADGGEPRENIMGVCQRAWNFDPGMLTRDWPGADVLVARLAESVCAPDLAVTLDFDVVVPARVARPVHVRARNLSAEPRDIALTIQGGPAGRTLRQRASAELPGGDARTLVSVDLPCPAGPSEIMATLQQGGREITARRTRFGCLPVETPPLAMGFSVFRAFRSPQVDEPYRDFVRTTGRLGMQYARLALAWEDLEPEPGRYVWDVADQLLALAAEEKITAFFWVFPTARGSGLSEGGVPAWTLREPSIDRHGNPGNFPCIWSPFYRERYFAFLTALARRYADDPRLARFVFDFGNSDFPYTYHFYGDRGDLFDYSPHEQAAFARWLEARAFPLPELARRWCRPFAHHREVPVPLSEQREAWLLYDEFRVWGVHQGIKEAVAVIHRHAPAKAPPDFPGHGIGSIADLGTYVHHAQARHWEQVQRHPPALVEAHNMGAQWGGEAWQVGGRYPDYDDALFQSIRLEADYLTIPGPDLGVWEEDIARVAMVRRSLAGARRLPPRVAILDRMNWNHWASLANVGARLDQPVDLVSRTCRYDYAEYGLFVLPPDEVEQTDRGPRSMLPLDDDYYRDLLDAVRRGLRILVFPQTGRGDPLNPLRRLWALEDVAYGPRTSRTVAYPRSWGGGLATGHACSLHLQPGDEPWLRDRDGDVVAGFRPCGQGGFILAGYDAQPDSMDGPFRYDHAPDLAGHTLARLLQHLDLVADRLRTGQACCYKEYLFHGDRDVLLLYSHHATPLPLDLVFRPRRAPGSIFELAHGDCFPVQASDDPGWYHLHLTLPPNRGLYLVIE